MLEFLNLFLPPFHCVDYFLHQLLLPEPHLSQILVLEPEASFSLHSPHNPVVRIWEEGYGHTWCVHSFELSGDLLGICCHFTWGKLQEGESLQIINRAKVVVGGKGIHLAHDQKGSFSSTTRYGP